MLETQVITSVNFFGVLPESYHSVFSEKDEDGDYKTTFECYNYRNIIFNYRFGDLLNSDGSAKSFESEIIINAHARSNKKTNEISKNI